MDVTLIVNGRDFSKRLSTYTVEKEIQSTSVVTTMDGTEHVGAYKCRDVIYFSLFPQSDETAQLDFTALNQANIEVSYTDPNSDGALREYIPMRVSSNLQSAFGLKSVDGNRYYKGAEITLRALSCG